ncbi:DUF6177 family protein [Streptomyces xantholiticus]
MAQPVRLVRRPPARHRAGDRRRGARRAGLARLDRHARPCPPGPSSTGRPVHAHHGTKTPPHHEPPPVPLSFTLGPDAAHTIGRAHAESVQHPRPTRLGPATRTALHYPLGNGTDPTSWHHLHHLNNHLKSRH